MASITWEGSGGCSGFDVLLQNQFLEGNVTCVADNSLTANSAVVVKAGAVVSFQSPTTTLGPDFTVETGAVLTVVAAAN
jgi:hypothetical protein